MAVLLNDPGVEARLVSLAGPCLVLASCIGSSDLTAASFPSQLYLWQALRAIGQPMAIMPLLMMSANAVSGPDEAPLINAIGLLLAEPPRAPEKELQPRAAVPGVPPLAPVGLPGALVRRRPDVLDAKARLHAATAQTGVAVASFYPDVSLTGSSNLNDFRPRNVFSLPPRAFDVGPAISIPAFRGRRLTGQLRLREPQQREAAISFQRTMLQAWQEAGNALTAYAEARRRRVDVAEAVRQNQAALAGARQHCADAWTTASTSSPPRPPSCNRKTTARTAMPRSRRQPGHSMPRPGRRLADRRTGPGEAGETSWPRPDRPRAKCGAGTSCGSAPISCKPEQRLEALVRPSETQRQMSDRPQGLQRRPPLSKHCSRMNADHRPARTRKPRGQGPSRRAEILGAAKRLFLQQGLQHATMRRIAADVGVSSTALYVYFPDKLAILDAIAEAMFEALLVALAKSREREDAPLPRLHAGLRAYIDLALSRPDEYRLIFEAKDQNACGESEAADKSFDTLQRDVAELVDDGQFAPANPLAVAEALLACAHGVVMLLLNQPMHIETPPQQLIDTVLGAAIKGFQAAVPAGRPGPRLQH